MSKEIAFIASVLDPFQERETALMRNLVDLNEIALKETLGKNKVVVNFEKNLETMQPLRNAFFDKFRILRTFYDNVHAKIDRDLHEFHRIRDAFSRANVEFILIKSDGSFPYESDNVDVLIRPAKLGAVVRLLRDAGYLELSKIRERHKFLFRNTKAFNVLPLHVHTRVEWEGTQFINSRDLWNKSETSGGNAGFLVPSPEDCVLITVAHLFFEDHEIKLADLLKIDAKIRNSRIDWDYMFKRSQGFHWNDAFCLTMLELDKLCSHLYGRTMLEERALSRIKASTKGWQSLFRKVIAMRDSGVTPLKIPYPVSGFFFLRKVLDDPGSSTVEKLTRLALIASDVIKRNTINRDPSLRKGFA